MSRIYFHSEDGTAEVRGSERFHMGSLCGNLLLVSIGSIWDTKDRPSWLRKYIPPGHYSLTMNDFERNVETWLRVGHDNLIVEGKEVSIFSIALNTAYRAGNDTIKLCARLHGQCEIHCYIEGPNRNWFAGMIEAGRKQNILRSDEGWEAVVELLRSSDTKPVVTSYSVCEQFPNAGVAVEAGLWTPPPYEDDDYEGDEMDWDAWHKLPKSEQWRMGMEALHANKGWLELKPDNWQTFYFDEGISGFDLAAAQWPPKD